MALLAHATPLQKVSLQLDWKYQFQYAGFIMAKEKGFYHDEGLEVELREYHNGINIVSNVLEQKATYGVYNSSIIIDRKSLRKIILMGTYLQRSPLIFVAQKGIKTPNDMMGKTIMATEDELKSSSLALLLNHFNISSKNAHFVKHTFNSQLFIEKKVDVMSAFRSNQLYKLDKLGIEYEIIDPEQYGFVMSATNLFTSPNEATKHPNRTQRFINATNRGWKYALDHPDETISILTSVYPCQKSHAALDYEAKAVKQLMLLDFYPIGAVNAELTQRAFKQLIQSGALAEDQKLGRYMFGDIIAHSHDSFVDQWISKLEEIPWIDSGFGWKLFFLLSIVTLVFIGRTITLKRYTRTLTQLSITDKLTGLYNRQKTDQTLEEEQNKVDRYKNYHCSIMIIDVDHFKKINDTKGHQIGDFVLVALASIVQNSLRNTDILGRWGGEEFIAILPHTNILEALVAAEGLRKKVETSIFTEAITVTISIGVGELLSSHSVHECIKQVDDALYKAKEAGRNKVQKSQE